MLFSIALVFGIISLIAVYNQSVNLKHEISLMKNQMQQIQAANAGLQDKLFSLFDPAKVAEFSAKQGLVKEKAPQYLPIESWALASHF